MANIVQIIKYEGDNDTFIWKHPEEDFNMGSQLIVHESQEAIFFMNGQALDLFGPGRYTLKTQNIPLVRNVLSKITNDATPFHCEVYFINKTEQMGIKWGTDSKVNYLDPNYNCYPFPIGASGQLSLRVADSRKLLVKLVGTASTLSQVTLASYFQAPMMTAIKSYLPAVLVARAIPIFDIDRHMSVFSEDLQVQLSAVFTDYGVEISKFWITALIKPEEDQTYRKIKELHGGQITAVGEAQLQQQVDIIHQQTKAQKTIIESQAIAQKRGIEGYSYDKERAYDVAEKVAGNDGIGNFSSAGIGMGMMGGMAGGFGVAMADITSSALGPITQPASGIPMQSVDLSMPPMLDLKLDGEPTHSNSTSSPKTASNDDIQSRIEKLEMLKGKIPDDWYASKLKDILDSI